MHQIFLVESQKSSQYLIGIYCECDPKNTLEVRRIENFIHLSDFKVLDVKRVKTEEEATKYIQMLTKRHGSNFYLLNLINTHKK